MLGLELGDEHNVLCVRSDVRSSEEQKFLAETEPRRRMLGRKKTDFNLPAAFKSCVGLTIIGSLVIQEDEKQFITLALVRNSWPLVEKFVVHCNATDFLVEQVLRAIDMGNFPQLTARQLLGDTVNTSLSCMKDMRPVTTLQELDISVTDIIDFQTPGPAKPVNVFAAFPNLTKLTVRDNGHEVDGFHRYFPSDWPYSVCSSMASGYLPNLRSLTVFLPACYHHGGDFFSGPAFVHEQLDYLQYVCKDAALDARQIVTVNTDV